LSSRAAAAAYGPAQHFYEPHLYVLEQSFQPNPSLNGIRKNNWVILSLASIQTSKDIT